MPFRFLSCCLALGAALTIALPAVAGPRDIWVLPTEVEAVPSSTPAELGPAAQRLDAVLAEAVQDFGFTPMAGEPPIQERDEPALTALAEDAWVLQARLGLTGGALALRLVVVPRGSNVLLVRAQRVEAADVEVRSLGMLRELIEPAAPRALGPRPEGLTPVAAEPSAVAPARSEGRAVLALHAAALGGYLGFSLQRASGSDDARLTYPLAALGAGVGVGSAVIVADEWDIDVARAWFLGASIVWPASAVLLIKEHDDRDPPGQRHLLGLMGAIGGLTLATAGLGLGEVSEGGAALTHSGAGLGLLLGGLGQMTVKGDAELTPRRGMGYGALAGVLVAGAVATQFEVPSSTDLLFIDLSALLGGLAGAALGTPVLVSQEASPTRDRIWLAGVMAGTLAGAGISYWVTQRDEPEPPVALGRRETSLEEGRGFRVRPQLGWMGMPLGVGLSGEW